MRWHYFTSYAPYSCAASWHGWKQSPARNGLRAYKASKSMLYPMLRTREAVITTAVLNNGCARHWDYCIYRCAAWLICMMAFCIIICWALFWLTSMSPFSEEERMKSFTARIRPITYLSLSLRVPAPVPAEWPYQPISLSSRTCPWWTHPWYPLCVSLWMQPRCAPAHLYENLYLLFTLKPFHTVEKLFSYCWKIIIIEMIICWYT